GGNLSGQPGGKFTEFFHQGCAAYSEKIAIFATSLLRKPRKGNNDIARHFVGRFVLKMGEIVVKFVVMQKYKYKRKAPNRLIRCFLHCFSLA
ncbi:hypothetical protein, partial [Duncaniella muris]|uniref:hypothetical protein n=1 Tax=Duncaniella muris TaxID=2094150 RepID=UPI002714F49E